MFVVTTSVPSAAPPALPNAQSLRACGARSSLMGDLFVSIVRASPRNATQYSALSVLLAA